MVETLATGTRAASVWHTVFGASDETVSLLVAAADFRWSGDYVAVHLAPKKKAEDEKLLRSAVVET